MVFFRLAMWCDEVCVGGSFGELRVGAGPSHLTPGLGSTEGKQRAVRGVIRVPDRAVQRMGTQQRFPPWNALKRARRYWF